MAQHITKIVTASALLCKRGVKLMHVYVALRDTSGAASLELYDDVNGDNAAKLIYKVDGTTDTPHMNINRVTRTNLYAKVTGDAHYNVIYD